ncbi:MAG: hypothetical protein K0R67_3679 [Paenibacillus sp.]|nr:hypothetical protein [Paenibacillus sp.]
MWKILLVEDEPFVRRSIRHAIDWEKAGFIITGEASHGLEALEVMAELKPDIVISDIIMPYMDGIELLQTARARGSEACFIMLTCANEFEYARMALEHGATSYILKLSMEDEQLMQALHKAKVQLAKKDEQKDRLLRDIFQDRLPIIWKDMFDKEVSAYEREMINEFHQMNQPYGKLIIVSALNGSLPFHFDSLHKLLSIRSTGTDRVQAVYSCMGHTSLFIWGDNREAPSFQRLSYGDIPVACRIASLELSFESEWFHNMRWLDDIYYDITPIAFMNRDERWKERLPSVPWDKEQEVIRLFERLSVHECSGKLTELWAYMKEVRMPMMLVKDTAVRLDKLFARISQKQAEDAGELLHCIRHQELLEAMIRRMNAYTKGRSRQILPETDHPEVNKIIRFLLLHYDSDISLQAMAQYVNMDENYLSGLFKKKIGDTFINYLQRIRVNEAKIYLEQTDLNVAEIGERVGFVNPSYFFKIFKRWAGFTPSEYRIEHKKIE